MLDTRLLKSINLIIRLTVRKNRFYDFVKRHPEWSLRQAEATSTVRARGFNKMTDGEYFDTLEALIDKHSP